MNNAIHLLDASLLDNKQQLKEISYWLKVLNRPNGWHYDLDIMWVLNELNKAQVLPGSTIIDAGAGQGIMQFLLAAHGYNVISLDFSPRTKPRPTRGIFNIVGEGEGDIGYQHPYMEFISYGVYSFANSVRDIWKIANLKKIPLIPQRIFRYGTYKLFNLYETFVNSHEKYGTITYLRAPFHKVQMESGCVDAIISLSAIEHADISLFEQNIEELMRLLKPKAPLLLTTSVTTLDKSVFHEKTSGWCYSLSALKNYFPNCDIKFDTESCSRGLIESEVLKSRLDPYYYQDKEAFCYKKNITALPYLPVSIKIIK